MKLCIRMCELRHEKMGVYTPTALRVCTVALLISLPLQHFEKFHEAARFYQRAIDLQINVSYCWHVGVDTVYRYIHVYHAAYTCKPGLHLRGGGRGHLPPPWILSAPPLGFDIINHTTPYPHIPNFAPPLPECLNEMLHTVYK